MSFVKDLFTKADADSSLGTGWLVRSTGSGASLTWAIATNQARARGSSTKLALFTGITQQGSPSFARVTQVANTGANTSVVVNGTITGTGVVFDGYVLQRSGTDIAIQKVVGGASTTVATVSFARVAGEELVLTAEHTTGQVVLKGWAAAAGSVDTTTTPLVTYTDTTSVITGGKPGLRHATTNDVYLDNFMGGDLADMATAVAAADSTTTAGGTTDGQSIIVTKNPVTADNVPVWRGLVYDRSGARIIPGEALHRRHFDFLGTAGTWTPPEGLSLLAGTATLTSPASAPGGLNLATGTAIGDQAGIGLAYPLGSTAHRAILLELVGVEFTAATGFDLRIDVGDAAFAGAGYYEIAGGARGYLVSAGRSNRTETDMQALGETSRRRRLSVLVICDTREVFLLVGDAVVGYRDCSATWNDGSLVPSVRIVNTAAASAALRLTSLTVTTYA